MSQKLGAFDAFCREAFDLLDEWGQRYFVIGGLAVIALGEARMTADVDVIAITSASDAMALVAMAASRGFEAKADIERQRLAATGTLRLTKPPFQLDIITASLPIEEEIYRRSTTARIFGCDVRLPTAEDLIILKVLAGRDKDILDAIGIVKRHRGTLDRQRIETTIQGICDIAEDMGPWSRLERVFHAAG